jgi:type I restriction-modification system DNA methylase subunit
MTVSSLRTSEIISAIVTLDSQEPKTGKRKHLASVLDFACGSGSLLLNVRKRMGPHGIGKIFGQEKNITTYNLARMNMLLHGVKDWEFEIYHGDTLTDDWDTRTRRWARTCASRTTDWPRSGPLTSRSCCTGFTTSRMTA